MMKKNIIVLLVVLLLGCTASDTDGEKQLHIYVSATEKIQELADDYGLTVKLSPLFSEISVEEIDANKIEKDFKALAHLKGSYILSGVKQTGKVFCLQTKSNRRVRRLASTENLTWELPSVSLNEDFVGSCTVTFHPYSAADVDAYIWSVSYIGTSSCDLTTEMKSDFVFFSGTVSYTYECYSGELNKKHTCVKGCRQCTSDYCSMWCNSNCTCDDCAWADSRDGNNEESLKTITIVYRVSGECSVNGGSVVWI